MSEVALDAEPILPVPPSKETIESFFKTIPDGHPDRYRIFKIRFRVPFYENSDKDDTYSQIGNIIQKVDIDDKKRKKEHDYFVMMDKEEFDNLYPDTTEGAITVKNIRRAVKFDVIGADPIYYKKPGISDVKKLAVGDNFFVFLNPLWVSHVNPDEIPAYEPALDPTGYGRSHK